jgi:hypothetical protein
VKKWTIQRNWEKRLRKNKRKNTTPKTEKMSNTDPTKNQR